MKKKCAVCGKPLKVGDWQSEDREDWKMAGIMDMTRSEAADRIMVHMFVHSVKEPNSPFITHALKMAIDALQSPWKKTSIVLPSEKDADPCMDVFAWHIDDGSVRVDYETVCNYPDLYPWWMIIPTVPWDKKEGNNND